MAELLHITEGPLWEAARGIGTYEMSTRGRTLHEEGFIHCSLPHQLPAVAEALYGAGSRPAAAEQDLVVLVIDSDRLTAPVRYEPGEPGGEDFPHLYGPLPVDAVVDVRPWRPEGGARA
ncbi:MULTISPECIES: DUF952 domain-containing protein [unclassified Streptomyces]|uniref:DUF952 domain-containing protein n=1 Tax=unclassified Streptomyces TaxID=2593676 RepID=UPI000DACCA18|nr:MULTISPECIES: DUF952 domain-containing protein [unclassified Streptomyces]PZT76592.1 DUF952 domain-containing protein [Streptomyces sp. AC1-42W]PZT79451.1 DUF952 domain-containing protein [Streptomyces sp. AC1-42T]WUC95924.1 DUF952 domain-containing protein [Streptomyces sp. NBC_00525]